METSTVRSPAIHISGIGVELPESVSVQDAAALGLYPVEEIEAHDLAGAAVAGDLPAPEMALRAARLAFSRCDVRPTDVDLLLYADSWHQGPDGWYPQAHLQRHLVGGSALAVEVRQGCGGMFSALDLALGYLRADPGRESALLVAADNYGTPLLDRWRAVPAAIFGDAATAVVLTKEPGFAEVLSVRHVTVPEAEQLHRGTLPLFPPSATTGETLDFTARLTEFRAVARSIPGALAAFESINTRMQEITLAAVKDAGIELSDITRVAFTHMSRLVLQQRALQELGLRPEQTAWEFARTVGHLGASDQFAAFDHLLTAGELGPGDHLLMMSISPGFTLSAAVIKVLTLPPWLA